MVVYLLDIVKVSIRHKVVLNPSSAESEHKIEHRILKVIQKMKTLPHGRENYDTRISHEYTKKMPFGIEKKVSGETDKRIALEDALYGRLDLHTLITSQPMNLLTKLSS